MIRLLSAIICVLCLFTTIYAEHAALNTVAVSARILFKAFFFLSFYLSGKMAMRTSFVAFLFIIISADMVAYIQEWGYVSCALFLGIYFVSCRDAWKQFKMNRLNYALWSFVGVLLINALLIGLHLKSLISGYQGDDGIIYWQTLYNLVLYGMITISLAYYLNSYSKKAIFFLVGSIAFLCSDILYGAYFFYGVGNFILPFHALLSAAGYVFFVKYFQTKEEPLLLESDILAEIEAMEQRKKLHGNLPVKHQVQG